MVILSSLTLILLSWAMTFGFVAFGVWCLSRAYAAFRGR